MSDNKEFSEILLYTTPNGTVKVEVFIQNENIWLTQQKIADLFGVQRPAVSKHFKNIFETGELQESMVCSILEHTTKHGAIEQKTQVTKTKYYNLDAIISVGYRVNSSQATSFRIWATERLKEYIIKGFTMDDWVIKLDAFLQFNENTVLKDQGKISHSVAITLAESEFEKYRIIQDRVYESDFDKAIKLIGKPKSKF